MGRIASAKDGITMMQRDVALRIDGIVSGVRSQLDWLGHTAKANLTDEEYSRVAGEVGIALGAVYQISTALYEEFPDIIPAEMRPPADS